jgi:hypothetical protein
VAAWNTEHDPGKWIPIFGKDHAPTITITKGGSAWEP